MVTTHSQKGNVAHGFGWIQQDDFVLHLGLKLGTDTIADEHWKWWMLNIMILTGV